MQILITVTLMLCMGMLQEWLFLAKYRRVVDNQIQSANLVVPHFVYEKCDFYIYFNIDLFCLLEDLSAVGSFGPVSSLLNRLDGMRFHHRTHRHTLLTNFVKISRKIFPARANDKCHYIHCWQAHTH